MGKHCNNSQCFKEKKTKAKFLISSILKKNQQRQFQKNNNKKKHKRGKKIMLETLQQFTVFCNESQSASPYNLVLL